MRVEDIDSPRVKPGATAQAYEDLKWLGLDWDAGPDIGGPHQPYIQTQRSSLYHAALEQLKAAERVYPCTCTRSDVAAAASAPHAGQEGPIYPGLCADRSAAEAVTILDRPYSWRFRTTLPRREYEDVIAGPQACSVSAELGDFVIGKADGSVSYQLAVVVDDHAMGVTEVVRGDDLIPSVFRQLELYDFFDWPAPRFAHVPLVVGSDGRRLAKRHGDTRLSVLREAGVPAARLVGLLAQSCGLRATADPITASQLLADFDLSRVPRSPFIFTEAMWLALLAGPLSPTTFS